MAVEDTNIGNLKDTLSDKAPDTGGQLGNLRTALRSALTEASQRQTTSRITQMATLLKGGVAPSVIQAAIGLAQKGLRQTRESIFSDIVEGVSDEQRLANERRKESLSLLQTFANTGVMAEMPDAILLEMGKSAGISEGLGLSWKSRIIETTKISDQMAALEKRKIQSEISENIAQVEKIKGETDERKKSVSEGFFDADTEEDVRNEAVGFKEQVDTGTITMDFALQNMRTLFSEEEVTDDALLKLMGIQQIGAEDIEEQEEETLPGLVSGGFVGPFFGTGEKRISRPVEGKTPIKNRIKEIQSEERFITRGSLKEQLRKEGYLESEIQEEFKIF